MPHCPSSHSSTSRSHKHHSCPHSREECPHCGSDSKDHASSGPQKHHSCPHSREECPHCGSESDRAEGHLSSGCNYDVSVHFTDEAQSYHQDKCVTRIMSTMSDPTQCVSYMSGVSEGNPDMAGCSIHNLMSICERKRSDFTQADAEELC